MWELDLCSRSILSEHGKKLWELTVTDENKSFVFSEFLPNNNINSSSLERALQKLLNTPGVQHPVSCLYYRSQIENIISRALRRLNIEAIPSRRCFALTTLLKERISTTLTLNPSFTTKNERVSKSNQLVQRLPDALRGDRWAFVQLPLGDLILESSKIQEGEIFGACPKLKWLNKDLPNTTIVPGIVVYSERAFPLAAWTNSHELAEISHQNEENCVAIDFGINKRWLYGRYRSNQAAKREAEEWERAKNKAKGIHFLAIQGDDDTDQIEGLWIMCNTEL